MLGFSRSKQADNTALLIGSFLLVSRWLFNDLSGFVFDLILLEFSTRYRRAFRRWCLVDDFRQNHKQRVRPTLSRFDIERMNSGYASPYRLRSL